MGAEAAVEKAATIGYTGHDRYPRAAELLLDCYGYRQADRRPDR